MGSPLDTILNTNPAPPTYSGTGYAATPNTPAAQSANQQFAVQQAQQEDAPPVVASPNIPLSPKDGGPDLSRTYQSPVMQPPNSPTTGGWLKQALQRFAYYGGQAALKHVGLPTDDELRMHQSEMAARQAQIDQIKQNSQLVPDTDENGNVRLDQYGRPTMLTRGQFTQLQKQREANKGKADIQNSKDAAAQNRDKINNLFKASNLGVQLVDDGQGGYKLQNLQKDEIAPAVAAKMEGKPNEIQLIGRAQQGDQEAQKMLDTLQGNRMALVRARGDAIGKSRLWMLQKAMDPETGEASYYTGFDILRNKQEGKNLIPMGALSSKDLISVQQLTSEAIPALKGVEDNLSAFDNANDRAIFAKVLKGAGTPARGQEAGWMGNVLNQALTSGLSDKGQKLAQADLRLAETMGRMRSTLGLPATDQSMALSLGLLPGASTPDSKYAKGLTQQLREMINQASGIPIYGGSGNAATKPAGSKQLDAATAKQFLDNAGGNPAKARAAAKAQGYSF
jgi:hypothetical protein